MSGLPTGTVTFLFTDIEGSTRLAQRLGGRLAGILAEYRRYVRAAAAKYGGCEVDTQGDAVFVAFSRASDAVAAAVAAQRSIGSHPWPEDGIVRVRMGLHTGEPVPAEAGYVGTDVHRAARVCAAGHGGQVLLTSTTRELLGQALPEHVHLRDLGRHRLKDLAEPQHLFQLVIPGLTADFPPLRSLDARPNNLPQHLTSFVGRKHEKTEVGRLLTKTRLLTLTGAGGAGKTRLALEVAGGLLRTFPDGVWIVELAALSDATLVPHVVAAALGVPEQPGRTFTDTLADALRLKSLLVVLDNCEHLLAACADLTGTLLRECSRLHILATSREPLGVTGETVWRVPSLSAPDPADRPTPGRIRRFEAVRLFVERAAAVRPGFRVTTDNARAIAQICHRVDGIPLAIELAAARVRALSPAEIDARLSDLLQLLTGGSRTALPRQRTLRATMDWSYALLTEREQTVLIRLSVFAGGWTLEAAEAVCAGDGIGVSEILDLLTSLVDKSLVLAEIQDGAARYGVLETVRQYGREHLDASGAAGSVRRRHRDWYLALAERGSAELDGPEQKAWLDRLDREYDNLRAALEWSRRTTQEVELGLRLAVHLQRFWEMRAYFAEARAWLDSLIAAGGTAQSGLRARALNTAGVLAYRQGDYERTAVLCSNALSLAEQRGDAHSAAQALHFLAHVRQSRGEYAEATQMMERSVQLYQDVNHRRGVANSVDCLGEVARSKGDYESAEILTRRAMRLYDEIGDARGHSHLLHNLAYIRLHQGRVAEARDLFLQSLIQARDLKSPRDVIMAIAGIAAAASKDTPPARVARLLGAVDGLLMAARIHLEPAEQTEFEHTAAFLRAQLGDRGFAAAWDSGRATTSDDAAAAALALAAPPGSGVPPPKRAGRRSHLRLANKKNERRKAYGNVAHRDEHRGAGSDAGEHSLSHRRKRRRGIRSGLRHRARRRRH